MITVEDGSGLGTGFGEGAETTLLKQRPVRSRDFEEDADALCRLIQAAPNWETPQYTLIAGLALRLCRAGSAGVSFLEPHNGAPGVRWRALAGDIDPVLGEAALASCVPCGLALESGLPALVISPALPFGALATLQPRVVEALSVPFVVAGETAGTVWVMSHRDDTRFDLSDAKILQTLGAFIAALLVKAQAREAGVLADANQLRLDALLENIPEGITIAKGSEVFITHVSRYGREVSGRPLETISGIPASEHSDRWQVYYPEGGQVPTERLPLTRACREGEIVRNEELILRRPDGTETTVLCNAGPIRRKDGSISGGVAAWRDVDDLKRARAALQSSEEMFRTLAESLPVNLYITSLDGSNTFANRYMCETMGGTHETFRGTGWTDYVHPDDRSLVQSIWQDAVDSAGEFYVEKYRSRVADGSYRWYATRGRPFNGHDGQPHGWCGAAFDIDDAQRARDELFAASKSKDMFLATMAHELRNPLAPIRIAAKVLQSKRIDNDAVAKCSTVIARQVAIMARLLDDLLDISRVTRGTLELRREPVQLWGLLNQAVETSRPLVDAHDHELVVRLPADPVQVTVDPVRITQVITNLLNNAANFTPAGGRIELSGGIDDQGVFVRVADNGIGLEPGTTERIFGMFERVDSATVSVPSGLGVGLALAKALVDLHGGRIEARSGGAGKGSEFWIRLPENAQVAGPADMPSARADKRALRILVVDDNVDIVESMAMLLRLEGHEVRSAGSGAEALTVAGEFQPEFVLLDIGMPKMDGFELARRLRQQRGLERTQLIAISGWGTGVDKAKALAAGFDLHLTKPVDPDRLVQVLAASVQSWL